MPDYDSRTYGCPRLVMLFEKAGAFKVRRDHQAVYVRPTTTIG